MLFENVSETTFTGIHGLVNYRETGREKYRCNEVCSRTKRLILSLWNRLQEIGRVRRLPG